MSSYKLRDYIDLISHVVSTYKNLRLHPVSVSFEITSYCNLKCPYCYNYFMAPERVKNLKKEEVYMILDKVLPFDIMEIIITGGEPFLRQDLLEIIRYIRNNYDVSITLQTNGTLLNEKRASFLGKIFSKYDVIQISLDGPQKIYENIKGAGLWERVIKNIELLKKEGLTVTINVVPTVLNINYLEDLAREIPYVDGLGASPLAVFSTDMKKLLPDPAQAVAAENAVKKILEERGIRYLGGIKGEFCQSISVEEYDLKLDNFKSKDVMDGITQCDAGITKFHISSAGDVYPCVYLQFPKFKMGNLLEKTFEEIWYSWDIDRTKRDLRGTPCANCPYFHICKGGCVGMAYAYYNTINAPDPRCSLNVRGV